MKRLIFLTCILYALSTPLFAQAKPSTPTRAEEREAKALAAAFFNRYIKKRDVTLLIREYFIKDFSKRVKFCGTTDECGGFGKDFWDKDEELTSLQGTDADYRRRYSAGLNYFFLYLQSARFLALSHNKKPTDIEGEEKIIKRELRRILGNNTEILKLDLFDGESGNVTPKILSLNQYRERLNDMERLIGALRIVEADSVANLKRTHPKIDLLFAPRAFGVTIAKNSRCFFNYPIGTRMLQVWPDGMEVPFQMDLIREDGKLKIVAVYPPID